MNVSVAFRAGADPFVQSKQIVRWALEVWSASGDCVLEPVEIGKLAGRANIAVGVLICRIGHYGGLDRAILLGGDCWMISGREGE